MKTILNLPLHRNLRIPSRSVFLSNLHFKELATLRSAKPQVKMMLLYTGEIPFSPKPTSLPMPPVCWVNNHTKKQIHKLIHNYPGKHTYSVISTLLGLNTDNIIYNCNELEKGGYIRKTSGNTFIAIKPFS